MGIVITHMVQQMCVHACMRVLVCKVQYMLVIAELLSLAKQDCYRLVGKVLRDNMPDRPV